MTSKPPIIPLSGLSSVGDRERTWERNYWRGPEVKSYGSATWLISSKLCKSFIFIFLPEIV